MKWELSLGLVSLLVLAVALAAVACGGGEEEAAKAAPAAPAPAAPAAPAPAPAAPAPAAPAAPAAKAAPAPAPAVEPAMAEEMKLDPTKPGVLIGHFTFMTGVAKALGDDANWGADLAAKEVNDAGGVLGGRKVIVKKYDQGYEGATVVASAKKALADGIVAVVGDMDATTCVPLMFLLKDKNEFPAVITSCGSEKITTEGYHGIVHLGGPYTALQNDDTVIGEETRWMESQGKRLYVVSNDSQYCRNLDTEMRRTVEKDNLPGVEIVDSIFFPFGASDARIEVTKAVGAKPDAIYFCQWGKELVVSSVKTARDLGYTGPLIVTIFDTPEAKELGPVYDKNTLGSALWFNDPAVPESAAFVKGLAEVSDGKATPSFLAEHSYVGMKLMLKAIEKAGSTDPKAIKDALYQVTFKTPYGDNLRFNSKGLRITPFTVLTEADENGVMHISHKLPIKWPEE